MGCYRSFERFTDVFSVADKDAAALKRGIVAIRGAAAPKTWHFFVRSDAQSAADFANQDPAQGAGEAVFSNRLDGQVDVYLYF